MLSENQKTRIATLTWLGYTTEAIAARLTLSVVTVAIERRSPSGLARIARVAEYYRAKADA